MIGQGLWRSRLSSDIRACAVAWAILAASAAPAGPVELVDDGEHWRVTNGRIELTVEKARNYLTSLRPAGGPELLIEGGGYWDLNANGTYSRFGHHIPVLAEVLRETPDLIELRIKTDPVARDLSNRMHLPVDLAVHYIVKRDDPGLYIFGVMRHTPELPPLTLGQTRYVLKLQEDFLQYFISDENTGLRPTCPPGTEPERVTDATFRFPGGRIATKYNNAEYEDGHRLHGMTTDAYGLWVISASNEYINGGPTKQDLTVHEDAPIVLSMLHSGHFVGADSGLSIEDDWRKLYGPFYIYVNSGETPETMWADAKMRADAEAGQWPYAWLTHEDYPLERGTVTGRLSLPEGAQDARVILGAPEPDWQVQGRGYLFWSHADEEGAFEITNVRPGEYTLYAWAPGVVGELRQDGIAVDAGGVTRLGSIPWHPPTTGRLLWQVGVPDRSAGEFRYGDQPRQFGLWRRYVEDFPDDVTFRIGQSDERADWNYCQPALQWPDGGWRLPEWKIIFDLEEAPAGEAVLWVGIAGSAGNARLVTRVNGAEVDRVVLPHDSCVTRDAVKSGRYRRRRSGVPAGLLRPGENVVSLAIENGLPQPGPYNELGLPAKAIMYDFIRLDLAQ